MKYLAPGKINLGLWVIRKRDDTYHDIVTVFHKIPLYDEIIVEEASDFKISCDMCPESKENSVYRAYKLLRDKTGKDINLSVKIKKKIPSKAGLGGGSSDAATFIKAANEILSLGLSQEEMMDIGKNVGADVPFFILRENAAIGEGLGDKLLPFHSHLAGLLEIYRPSFGISTGWAYSMIDALSIYTPYKEAIKKALLIMDGLKMGKVYKVIENVFEKIVVEQHEELQEYKKDALMKGASLSLLSGSGSCMFSIYPKDNVFRIRYIEDI